MTGTSDPLALLIDGDNASPKIGSGFLAEIATYGTASVKRIYGDWTSPTSTAGKSACWRIPSNRSRFAYTTERMPRNGAMIIDAMDLLYTERFSAFCIVSSDSDFAKLASRIREQCISNLGAGTIEARRCRVEDA